jgi:hypothetical protein
VNVRLASSLFTLGKRKKMAGARSSKYGGSLMTWNCLAAILFVTMASCAPEHYPGETTSPRQPSLAASAKNLQKLAQGLNDVLGIHCGPLGVVVCLDQALSVEEG